MISDEDFSSIFSLVLSTVNTYSSYMKTDPENWALVFDQNEYALSIMASASEQSFAFYYSRFYYVKKLIDFIEKNEKARVSILMPVYETIKEHDLDVLDGFAFFSENQEEESELRAFSIEILGDHLHKKVEEVIEATLLLLKIFEREGKKQDQEEDAIEKIFNQIGWKR